MGNAAPQVKTAGGAAQRDPLNYLQHDLPKLIKKNELGTGKFMKSFLCKVEEGTPVVVKVYVRHEGESQDELDRARDGIEQIFIKLKNGNKPHPPNVLPYQRAVIGQQLRGRLTSAGYVIRQHFYTSLNDRLSTRPFLSQMEKKWIIYQLFQAIRQCHACQVCHGDIKTENVMVTSWTWIILTDFASFKPTYLPEDDPTDFNHYFASSGGSSQHRCYLAPERFYSSTAEAETDASFKGLDPKEKDKSGSSSSSSSSSHRKRNDSLEASMDIFSLGCVIAEVFIGSSVLDLPMLLQYRTCKEELTPPLLDKLSKLEKIAGPEITNLVKSMLGRDPVGRKTAADYLERCENGVNPIFPSSLKFLFRFFSVLQSEVHTPDDRILFICRHYGQIMRRCAYLEDEEGAAFFSHFAPSELSLPGNDLKDEFSDDGNLANVTQSSKSANSKRVSVTTTFNSSSSHDSNQVNKLSSSEEVEALAEETRRLIAELDSNDPSSIGSPEPPPPLPPHVLNPLAPTSEDEEGDNALIMIAQLVCASMRHVTQPQCKLLSLQLLLRFGRHLNDEARLQRLVPYIMSLLDDADQIAAVRASAVRVVRDILALVTRFPASDADIFPKYIFPTMHKLPTDSEELVRIAFAESIAGLAESSRRFLDTSHCLTLSQQSDANTSSSASNDNKATPAVGFDEKLEQLHNTVSKWIHDLVGDMDGSLGNMSSESAHNSAGPRSNLVKRALLRDITRLCIFFGSSGSEQKILPLLITMINDRDWELRYAFCAHIPALGAFLGPTVTDSFIMPLSHPLIVDVEELVVSRALRCLATLAELGLLTRQIMLERTGYAGPLLLHPNSWVRHAAASLIASVARRLGPADAFCFLFPPISAFFAHDMTTLGDVTSLTQEEVLLAALTPISRNAFKLELLRIAEDIKKPAGQPPAVMDSSVSEEERVKLASMTLYLKAAARNLMQKMQNGGGDRGSSPPPPSPMALGQSSSSDPGGHLARRERPMLTKGGGEMSRLQIHSERLNATPCSSLFIPKSVSAPEIVGNRGNRVGERDALFPTLKKLLDSHYLAQSAASGQWWTPRELRDAGRLQALYGVTTNARDAVRLARSSAHSEDDSDMGGVDGRRRVDTRDGELSRLRTVEETPSSGLASPGGGGGGNRGLVNDHIIAHDGVDSATLLRRIIALGLPPLPPDLGAPRRHRHGGGSDGASMSSLNGGGGSGGKGKEWRPKIGGVVVQTLVEHVPKEEHGGFKQGPMYSHEHAGAVNRLAVSPDHSFFVSSSSDSTSRVWGTAQLESNVSPRAAAVYAQQSGGILDACIVENTRSVATASDAGDVHVWRVDLINGSDKSGSGSGSGSNKNGKGGAMGTAEVRRTALEKEGPVLAVAHVNSDTASMVLFATQRGYIHCWDLRSEEEPWKLRVNPELGFLTTLAVGSGTEKHWLCAGTSRGYVLIWDMRFQLLVRLWRHSSKSTIYRLATCARLPEDPEGVAAAPLAFVAAGQSELAVWNLDTGGECRRCFRSLSPQEGPSNAVLPTLDAIPIPGHPESPILGINTTQDVLKEQFNSIGSGFDGQHSVRAIMGRISTNGNSYVITGSTDRHIRFWDMTTPSKCFTVSGLEPGQPRPVYDSVPGSGSSAPLFVCYDADVPSLDNVVSSHLPIREQRGLVTPSSSHNDAILDLKGIDLPTKMMISSSRDGVVKCWK